MMGVVANARRRRVRLSVQRMRKVSTSVSRLAICV